DSTLFTEDLAGECRAVARAWGIPEGKKIDWPIGVVSAPAREVRRAIRMTTRVYLLIVNTPNECVIGGDAKGVKRIVAILGCSFFQLSGVTTVHCEVAREVAQPYRDLHLFNTNPPDGVTFDSGAEGGAYEVNRESAADAILAQALEGINYPAVINSAYADGVRIFLEMGPGASCSRMIDQILEGRPHLARSTSPRFISSRRKPSVRQRPEQSSRYLSGANPLPLRNCLRSRFLPLLLRRLFRRRLLPGNRWRKATKAQSGLSLNRSERIRETRCSGSLPLLRRQSSRPMKRTSGSPKA